MHRSESPGASVESTELCAVATGRAKTIRPVKHRFDPRREDADHVYFRPYVIDQFHKLSPRHSSFSPNVDDPLGTIGHDLTQPLNGFGKRSIRFCVQFCPVSADCGSNYKAAVPARFPRSG